MQTKSCRCHLLPSTRFVATPADSALNCGQILPFKKGLTLPENEAVQREEWRGMSEIYKNLTSKIINADLPVMTRRPLVALSRVSPVSLCFVRHW
jgi:hypothetical protein